MRLGDSGTDLDQRLGAPAVEFAPVGAGLAGFQPLRDGGGEPFGLEIIVEAQGRKFADRCTGFEDYHMRARPVKNQISVIIAAFGVEKGALVDTAGGGDVGKAQHTASGYSPALTGGPMAYKQGDGHRFPGANGKAGWLDPEVVRDSGRDDGAADTHGNHQSTSGVHSRAPAGERKWRPLLRYAATAISVFILTTPAAAHSGTGLPGGVTAGFLHPFSGFDHMLAMVSVGLWGAFLGRPLIVLLPVIFPAVMAVGGAMGIIGVPLPPVELGIALSVIVLGAMIAGAVRAPIWLACAIVAVFALFHGYAHGQELPSAADPIGYSLGFVLATGTLHVVGIGIGTLSDRPGGAVAVRVIGALIAGCGIWFLVRSLAL